MGQQLRAVVVGAGWAGEGHTKALQWCGVDVVAICARQPEVVRQVAERLGVPEASIDWRQTLEAVRPDIVALATPAGLREPVVQVAAQQGCHVLCDKPLVRTGAEAGHLYRLVEEAGVKHAFAATHGYSPWATWLGELVRDGAIGTLREIHQTHRTQFGQPLTPWHWGDVLEQGGGAMNNGLPHLFSIWSTVTGGELVRAMGRAVVGRDRAPVVPNIHDHRAMRAVKLTAEEAEHLEWRACDADEGWSALFEYRTPTGPVPIASLLSPGTEVAAEGQGSRLYGDAGTLITDGMFQFNVARVGAPGETPEPLPVPQRLLDSVPPLGEYVLNNWAALARDFVADIRGEPHGRYPTFRDGWRYQVAIDAVRAGTWCELPESPALPPSACASGPALRGPGTGSR